VNGIRVVDLKRPALLEFRGPDAVRFLNGQLTQDVRLVAGGKISLPSCVTDAKGKLQFRVTIMAADDGALWMEGPAEVSSRLEARVTRYLIADDVEAADLTGTASLLHLIGDVPEPPAGIIARASRRYGAEGADWWVPQGMECPLPEGAAFLSGVELEALRISNGVPAWGRELTEGMLPPEAGLDATDISYQKGCYIGQEVISRIKFSGKLNRKLVRLSLDPDLPVEGACLTGADGEPAGQLTSVSPLVIDGKRPALAYVKRGVGELFLASADGTIRRQLAL